MSIGMDELNVPDEDIGIYVEESEMEESIYLKVHKLWMGELRKEIAAAVRESCEVLEICSGWYATFLYSVLTLNRRVEQQVSFDFGWHRWRECAAERLRLRLKYRRRIINRRMKTRSTHDCFTLTEKSSKLSINYLSLYLSFSHKYCERPLRAPNVVDSVQLISWYRFYKTYKQKPVYVKLAIGPCMRSVLKIC